MVSRKSCSSLTAGATLEPRAWRNMSDRRCEVAAESEQCHEDRLCVRVFPQSKVGVGNARA